MRRPRPRAAMFGVLLSGVVLGAMPRVTGADDGLILYAPCHGHLRWDPGCPGPKTPEEEAERAKFLAAEKRARKKRQAFDMRVDDEAARLGPGREAEARRLVEMREAAERAAGLKPAPLPDGDDPLPPLKKCKTKPTAGSTWSNGSTEQEARKYLQGTVAKRCTLTSGACKTHFPGWVTCKGTWECPAVEFTCSPAVKA